MVVFDLTHPITTGMPVYPGDPEVRVSEALTVLADGVAVSRIEMGSHAGTHLDAPSHSVVGGMTVESIPLDWLMGEAAILRLSEETSADQAIDVSMLSEPLPRALPLIVCVTSGWDQFFGSELYLDHPFLTLNFVRELWIRGVRVLGVDALSPDPSNNNETLAVHEFWLGSGGVLVENLNGLSELPRRVQLTLLPLKLAGGDGSPIRAIATLPDLGETLTSEIEAE